MAALEFFKKNSSFLTQYPSVHGYMKTQTLDQSCLMLGPLIQRGVNADLYVGMYQRSPVEILKVAVKLLRPDVCVTVSGKDDASTTGEYSPIGTPGISLDDLDDEKSYAEFCREVSVLRKAKHKNVVKIIGALTLDLSRIKNLKHTARNPNEKKLAIVLELMEGGSVTDYLSKWGAPLGIPEVLKIGRDVARGMEYLHSMGIVHRDLKPSNFLLDNDGAVKVADFGVSRKGGGEMTAEVGTYKYMAPEMLSHEPYSNSVDVFSFAMSLSELLTNKVPYSEMTPVQAAFSIVTRDLRPALPDTCPPELKVMIAECWAKDRATRPSFGVIATRLDAMAKQFPEPTISPSVIQTDNVKKLVDAWKTELARYDTTVPKKTKNFSKMLKGFFKGKWARSSIKNGRKSCSSLDSPTSSLYGTNPNSQP